MKTYFFALAASLLATTSVGVHAQATTDRTEQAGVAVGGYYGRAVILDTLSQSKCKSNLKLPKADFNLKKIRGDIERTISKNFPKDVVQSLPEIFSELESKYAREDFSVAMIQDKVKDCQFLADDLTQNFLKGKKDWQSFADKQLKH